MFCRAYMKNKRFVKAAIIVVFVVAAGIIFCISVENKQPEVVISEEEFNEAETTVPSVLETETAAEICVHVCGSVESPGVYFLPEGSRVNDAVLIAGGFSDEASSEYLNLAELLKDGEQVYIPSLEELYGEDGGYSKINIDDGLININTASAEELKTLPGIGDAKAAAIIAYRNNTAKFETIEDIMKVSGIKENAFQQIKEYIKV